MRGGKEGNDGQIPPTSPPRAMMDEIVAMAETIGVLPHYASILKLFLDNCVILSFIT